MWASPVLALYLLTFLSLFLRGGFGISVRFKETSVERNTKSTSHNDVRDQVNTDPHVSGAKKVKAVVINPLKERSNKSTATQKISPR